MEKPNQTMTLFDADPKYSPLDATWAFWLKLKLSKVSTSSEAHVTTCIQIPYRL